MCCSHTFYMLTVTNFFHLQVTVELSDLNDNAPEFSPVPLYWRLEEAAYLAPHVLGYVQASDVDEGPNQQLVYDLLNGIHGTWHQLIFAQFSF